MSDAPPVGGGQGQFFAVEGTAFHRAVTLGMNAAVAYLVLARFTDRQNLITAASVNAVERYTGISRHRARDAIAELSSQGLLRPHSGAGRPRRELVPSQEAHRALTGAKLDLLAPAERELYEQVRKGVTRIPQQLVKPRNVLIRAGLIAETTGGYRATEEAEPGAVKIWLPNAVVDGARNEIAPIELLRQTQDVLLLRLFIDMYGHQHLTREGGIPRAELWQSWTRERVAEHREYVLWRFEQEDARFHWSDLFAPHRCFVDLGAGGLRSEADDVRRRIRLLEQLGLFIWVPCVLESDGPEAEIIHPYCHEGEPVERELARACSDAAESLLLEVSRHRVNAGPGLLVPVKRHIAAVCMVSVARLRYRPRTSLTSDWFRQLVRTCKVHQERYTMLVRQMPDLLRPSAGQRPIGKA